MCIFTVIRVVYCCIYCNRSGICVYLLQYEWFVCIFTAL